MASHGTRAYRAQLQAEKEAKVEGLVTSYETALKKFQKSGSATDRAAALKAGRAVREVNGKFKLDSALL